MSQFDAPNVNQFESPQQTDTQEKKGLGCFVWGCLITLVVVLLLVVISGWAAYSFAKKQINKYTDDTPANLPVVEANAEEVAELKARVEKMQADIEAGQASGELVLTADDINKLIAADDELKGRVYVTIEEDKVKGEVSIPTDFFPMAKGRYFNASATLDVSYEGGILIVTLVDAEVKGEPLPKEFVDAIAQENLAKDVYKDPENAKMLRQFESIEVRDSKIILKARPEASDAEAAGDAEAEPPAELEQEPVGAAGE